MTLLVDLLTSPYIQFFLLGLLAALFRSDLVIPDQVTKAIAMYLMLAIGMKGGLSLIHGGVQENHAIPVLLLGVAMSALMPLVGYFLLRQTAHLNKIDAASTAAHYGSVSVVTFSYAVSMLADMGLKAPGYIVTLMALMEAPAILTGLMLARIGTPAQDQPQHSMWQVLKEALMSGSLVLLLGGMLIAATAEPHKMETLHRYFIDPFQAVLCLFLLELGLVAARQMRNFRMLKLPIILFAIYMPLIGATVALCTGMALHLSLAEMVIFATLCASASYIAVPAAVKLALPTANTSLSITCSLAITFPFNLLLGVPLYRAVAQWLLGQ